ncbi:MULTISPECIES: iron uptake transporter permease EfeU [Dactylosporangium]|uniref:Iron transporter n=2 Tax=Dactylosporangium TaxID=35753 RepID=A0A9W6KSL3_9ACTN|nr:MULTISPECIES: iron uptake transporter permease EfeU [Dactylosporangium]UAB95760.1 FTR1 family protein [Dactylosporangium vinaceum]UWZ44119.1 FTR1 family protein [Dactylosporangium matsuzakiense]GLL07411.1 iron transporter [Dactylosporangium matsuzakiense]
MTAIYLIGLREGLEITLVVSILVAFLVKSDRKHLLKWVWSGVAVAALLSIGVAALLQAGTAYLSGPHQELVDAIASLIAVVFVTFMIFWMRRMARQMSKELRGRLEDAIQVGPFAVAGMAFLAVAREGLETSILFFAAAQGADDWQPFVGITLGLATAVVLGFLLYASAVRINLTKFFTWTGALLVLVAAGILKYGVHDLQEANVLPGLNNHAFDLTGALPPTAWYAELLRGMFNFTPQPSVLETIAWIAYGVPVLVLFLLPMLRKPAPEPAPSNA